jgi:outer membrane protein TolC
MDVTLQYSLVGEGDNFDSSMELDETRIGVGLAMDFNIAGAVNDEPRRLAIAYRGRERAYQRLQSEIRTEVRSATFALREKAAELGLAREGLVIAQQQYRFAELRYAKGTAGTEEVLEKEQELSDARQRELAARVEYLVSSYDVQRASGTLAEQWQR